MKKFIILALITLGIVVIAGFFFILTSNILSKEWDKRINAALEPYECPSAPKTTLPNSYYQGPLIDTHLHIPQLPDDFGGEIENHKKPQGVDSYLYDTIPESEVPLLGRSVTIDQIACTLKQEGSSKAFAFFPVFPESYIPQIELATKTIKRYPDLLIPFIQASGNEVAIVEENVLRKMLKVNPNLFDGLGEVGDSPTEPINPPPDSTIYLENFEVAREKNLLVYFHPGQGHHKNLERALKKYPDVTFIVHADFIDPYIDGLIDRNPNVYYTANSIFEEITPLFRFEEKEKFITTMERDWDILLKQALIKYKPLIEAHPDRYMWGTDRADIAWNYDADVGILLAKYGRAFIGQLDPAVQEQFAYKNAERLIQQTKE